jgi:phage terminase small subunit
LKNSAMKPPAHLSAAAKRWYRDMSSEYGIADRGGLSLLRAAAEAFDRAEGARKSIEADGAAIRDRWGQLKPHPLLAAERDARAQLIQALRALNLDVEPVHEGRGRPSGR